MTSLKDAAANITQSAEDNIKYFAIDLCRMLKNIRETSLNESDKIHRLEELAAKTGIHSTILKDLC